MRLREGDAANLGSGVGLPNGAVGFAGIARQVVWLSQMAPTRNTRNEGADSNLSQGSAIGSSDRSRHRPALACDRDACERGIEAAPPWRYPGHEPETWVDALIWRSRLY